MGGGERGELSVKSISCLIKRSCPPDEPASDSAIGVIPSSCCGLLTAFCVCENSRQFLQGSLIQACNTKLLPTGTCWCSLPGGPRGQLPGSSGSWGTEPAGLPRDTRLIRRPQAARQGASRSPGQHAVVRMH